MGRKLEQYAQLVHRFSPHYPKTGAFGFRITMTDYKTSFHDVTVKASGTNASQTAGGSSAVTEIDHQGVES